MSGFFGAFLQATEHGEHSFIGEFLEGSLGDFGVFLDSVLLHGLLDTVKLVPFLFLTYLLMEFLEHKATDKIRGAMLRAGKFGPALGGVFGAIPQCGFSAVATNLYTGRVITVGTLVAVYLSTSDEMLPILIGANADPLGIFMIILYKILVGIAVGFGVDFVIGRVFGDRRKINIDEICDNDNCHCERGILPSALHHTLTVSVFVLIATVAINLLLFFVGEENLSAVIPKIPVVSHIICAIIGLIPNCASSVVLTQCALGGIISVGAMISGLLTGAGVGMLILFRMNRHPKENLMILALLVCAGTLFGLVAEFIPWLTV